jgi:hypothetical protein
MSHAFALNGLSDMETHIENAPCNRPQSPPDLRNLAEFVGPVDFMK